VPDQLVNVRYMVEDVEGAVDVYTTHFGFTTERGVFLLLTKHGVPPWMVSTSARGVGGTSCGAWGATTGPGEAQRLLRQFESGPRRSRSPDGVDAWAEVAVTGEVARLGEAADVADLGGDRVGEQPADPGHRQ
jgi:hypothetical protein